MKRFGLLISVSAAAGAAAAIIGVGAPTASADSMLCIPLPYVPCSPAALAAPAAPIGVPGLVPVLNAPADAPRCPPTCKNLETNVGNTTISGDG